MSRLSWDGVREYETGVDRGVFFPKNGDPEPWTGLISVEETPDERGSFVRYQDGVKFVNHRAEGPLSARIISFFLPPSFSTHREFDFSYRVTTLNGYKIHLVYNALPVTPENSYSQQQNLNSINVDISTRSLAIITSGTISEYKSTSHIIIDTSAAYPDTIVEFEDTLYGSETLTARLPLPSEVFDIFESNALFKIIDNGNGTFTMDAPDDVFDWLSLTEVQVDWPSISFVNEDMYVIRSW